MGEKRLDELGSLVEAHRKGRKLSLRKAADETGIAFNSLARIEKGYLPDLETFRRLIEWLGVPVSHFFERRETPSAPTLEAIEAHLREDPALPDEAGERIAAIVCDLYGALAKPEETPAAVHLRAARSFRPEAAQQLGAILQDLHAALAEG